MIQVNPPIPLNVVGGAGWAGPTGFAICHFLIDNGPEHHLTWVVFMDDTGQCWSVETPFIRAVKNITWGRLNPETCSKEKEQEVSR